MQLKCKSCNELYDINFKKIIECINKKQQLNLCKDCYLNKKWKIKFEKQKHRTSCYFHVNSNAIPDIDAYDVGLYSKLDQIIDRNKRYQKNKKGKIRSERPLYVKLSLNDSDDIISGFPIGIQKLYLVLKEDLYSPNLDNGLHCMGDNEFKIPFHRISNIRVYFDYADVYCPDVSEPIIGYKAVPEEKGVLRTHNYIYEIGVPYEEEQRNIYITDFQDCYSHFCRKIEDVVMCSGKTDYISSQINYAEDNFFFTITRLFKIKAEKHCLQNTKFGWVSNKLTILEEVTKEDIISYFEKNADAKEKIIKHYDDLQIFEKLNNSQVKQYVSRYSNAYEIYARFIKKCVDFNTEQCVQGNNIHSELCRTCSYQGMPGRFNFNTKELRYLLVKHRILNNTFTEDDADYIYLKEHKCNVEIESIQRLLIHYNVQ